jgi:DNA-binding transcriptional ArsR family regulator
VDGWTALADPTRRTIFELVIARPRAVGELAAQLPITRPAVSQHLKLLKSAGLVHFDVVGTRRIYHVDRNGLAKLRAELDRFWNEALSNFKEIVEQTKEDA